MKKLRYILLALMICTLSSLQAQIPASSQRYVAKAVDLGLPSGTLWADRNMGIVEKPTEFGVYYSWGNIYSSNEAVPEN